MTTLTQLIGADGVLAATPTDLVPDGTYSTSSSKGLAATNRAATARMIGGVYYDTAATGGLVTVINYTGSGVITFLAGGNSGGISNQIRVTLDGTIVFDETVNTADYIIVVGAVGETDTSGELACLAFEAVPFSSSFKVEQLAAAGSMYLVSKWRKVS